MCRLRNKIINYQLNSYPERTRRNCFIAEVKSAFEQVVQKGGVGFEQVVQNLRGREFWLAGRVIGVLDEGVVLQDESGRIEVVGENFNIGDIVEVRVEGEMVVKDGKSLVIYLAREGLVLAPCGEEFFIGKDSPNYLKSIIDLNFKERLLQRAKIIQMIRQFFLDRNFVETDTPELVKLPGMEPYLDVFKTKFHGLPKEGREAFKEDMYLITSPEYALKKLLVGGFEKIFQITKSFRNKETDSNLHNPEFTILEWYRAYASYLEIMDDVEALFKFLGAKFPKWDRIKVKDAFKNYAGIGYDDFEDTEKFRAIVKKKGYKVDAATSFDDLFFLVFMNEIEPKLGFDKPVILYEYPASMAALSKKCEDDPKYAERFEVYINGMELCNAFTELNDPKEQELRLQEERKARQKMGKQDYPVDQSFIRALDFGMPPSGGIALGVDRLIMLLTEAKDIKDVLFFPHGDLGK